MHEKPEGAIGLGKTKPEPGLISLGPSNTAPESKPPPPISYHLLFRVSQWGSSNWSSRVKVQQMREHTALTEMAATIEVALFHKSDRSSRST